MLTKSFEVWTRSLIQSLYNAIRRGNDVTRIAALNLVSTALPSEKCVYVTIINTTGSNVSIVVNATANAGVPISLPDKTGITIDVVDTSVIEVSGVGNLSYIVSK
jgi:hypothetical protein